VRFYLILLLVLIVIAGLGYWSFITYFNQEEQQVIDEPEEIEKSRAEGAWCVGSDCYWFDSEGIIFDTAPRPEGSLVTVIDDIDDNFDIGRGNLVVERDLWQNLKTIINSWLTEEFVITKMVADREKQELSVATAKGLDFYLSLRFSPENNLEALRQLDLAGLKYVDLRVENRLYYK